jgi:glycosyltransferase involved in cell wall biosynthesis
MLENQTIAVIVPAYNEGIRIGQVLETMPKIVDRIFVIDDASQDNTSAVAEQHRERDSRIELVQRPFRGGVGAAIGTGYQICIAKNVEVAAVMAGDGQMDPADFLAIVEPVVHGTADYVKGNRLFQESSWNAIPHSRYFGNSVLSLLTKIASGYWHIADSQCGYTAISGSTLLRLDLKNIYADYGMPNDLLIKLNLIGARVRDVPVRPVYGVGEKSGIRLWKVIPKISFLLLRGFFRRLIVRYVIQDFHPLVFFYLMGILLFPLGTAFGFYLFLYRLLAGPVEPTSALFAAFLFISGLQSLFFAMWFDTELNRHLK